MCVNNVRCLGANLTMSISIFKGVSIGCVRLTHVDVDLSFFPFSACIKRCIHGVFLSPMGAMHPQANYSVGFEPSSPSFRSGVLPVSKKLFRIIN